MSDKPSNVFIEPSQSPVKAKPIMGDAIPRRWIWPTRTMARIIMSLAGWRIEGHVPDVAKILLVGAPHTSNLDYLLTLLTAMSLGVDLHYVAKRQLFDHPFGELFRWLGGVRLDRQGTNGFVEQMVSEFQRRETFVLAIMPEGTRSAVKFWRTGFYYIAHHANVPIMLVTFNYGERVMSLGPSLYPTGNLEADLSAIQSHYAGVQGRHPQ